MGQEMKGTSVISTAALSSDDEESVASKVGLVGNRPHATSYATYATSSNGPNGDKDGVQAGEIHHVAGCTCCTYRGLRMAAERRRSALPSTRQQWIA